MPMLNRSPGGADQVSYRCDKTEQVTNLSKPSEISAFQRETEHGVAETEFLTLLAALYLMPIATGEP